MQHHKLARLCKASYEGTEEVRKEMFGAFNPSDHKMNWVFEIDNQETHTQAYIAIDNSEKEVVLVFRGTECWRDFLTDICFIKRKCPDRHSIHSGFLNAYNSVKDQIQQLLYNNAPIEYKFYATGHSLGGALASVHTLEGLIKPDHLITFGSPRFCGLVGARDLDCYDVVRYVNGCDIVACIPRIGYRHGGDMYYINKKGEVLINPSLLTRLADKLRNFGYFSDHKIVNYLKAGFPRFSNTTTNG